MICYLCGELGADSKDHVPPKCFLPEDNYQGYQRITVPAHRHCNSGQSADEEYLRDLLIPEAVERGLPKAELLYDRVWRAWAKPGGWKRYQNFLSTSYVVEKRTKSGLYAGRALGVIPDVDRVSAVGVKVARGIIFHDANAFLKSSKIAVAPLSVEDATRERESNVDEPYWIGLNNTACLHDTCADTVALRRFYEGIPTEKGVMIVAHLAIIVWNLFYACSTIFPIEDVRRRDFKFAINTTNGSWVHNDAPPEV